MVYDKNNKNENRCDQYGGDTAEKENITKEIVAQMELYDEPKVKGYGYRHQQTFLLFVCLTVAYSMRTCIGVAMVAMVHGGQDQNTNMINSSNGIETDNQDTGNVGIMNGIMFSEPLPKFNWDKKTQDYVIASFSWGYVILQIPAGQLVHRYGTRYLLTGALLINGILSFSTPWAAYYGSWVSVVVLRMFQGLTQSCLIPGMHTAFGKWVPLEERGRLSAFAYGGQPLGVVLGLPITGYLAASPLGWPGIFRFYGLLSLAVAVVLWFLGADSPAHHLKISEAEKRYIEKALGESDAKRKKQLAVPWKEMFKCKALYAIVFAHIGQSWGHLSLYTEVPAFMDKVMKVNIKANGLLTALPFFVMWASNFFFCWFADMLIVKKWLSVTNTRKLANSIGSVIPATGLVLLAYVEKDIIVIETILITICSFKTAYHVGCYINHLDLAPNFAGTMMSISNFVANACSSMAPVVAGFILVSDVTSEFLWRKVFLLAAGIYFVSNLVYVIIGSANLQKWNNPEGEMRQDIENGEEKPMLQDQNRNV